MVGKKVVSKWITEKAIVQGDVLSPYFLNTAYALEMKKIVLTLMHPMHSVKNQANSFATIKACYPFTIKGELFSLLCYQPRGDTSFFENPDTNRYR